ncbi:MULTISPECIES: TrmB family transcriptional regulator [Haloferax]|uniref:TrmB family transcriptional regulator n=4 Tax=Haloferax TaxID=2251 RepID=A0A6C0UVE0_HALVO|nr:MULTISPECIES: helix-turn-helix domain-containing protein [Haloferax]ELK55594.1 sugar-specific transcriptional regulator [Haloferax sp. BAB-2207]ELZ75319.1 sugar-specific transcriptional regulator [Haloferax lucentense DSM 14919]ELZ87931.1 sugar-specific transcriptional regulator [Haloferax alexandrinus JCM 10717]NLV03650.1 TrmB family transcriptional regulator [Haloferax alexandrinus]QIB79150.1 TrmB family transcriptional regulator [Haloferax alexandrinus]
MDNSEAIDALIELGLSTYEARVFTALIELGEGTAREVAKTSDVPRSQVYTTAKELQSRGFISVQRANPQVFQPISLSEVESQLSREFESKRDTAFDRLETLERQTAPSAEQSEDVWTITGTPAIIGRASQLIDEAETRVIYGAKDLAHPDAELLSSVRSCCSREVPVLLLQNNGQEIAEPWRETECVSSVSVPPQQSKSEHAVRLLLVDSDSFLLSVRSNRSAPEIAIWSANTTFAEAFLQLLTSSLPVTE